MNAEAISEYRVSPIKLLHKPLEYKYSFEKEMLQVDIIRCHKYTWYGKTDH